MNGQRESTAPLRASITKEVSLFALSTVEMPPKRKLLVLLNPFSGAGQAARSWDASLPILEKSHVDINLIRT
jgi:hypothetical protein